MIGDWIFKIAAGKVVKRVVILICSYIFTNIGIQTMAALGITVDQTKFQNELMVLMYAGLEFIRNWVKQKYKLSWL